MSIKFAVMGAGGVGGYFAAVLARAGYSVALIARGEHAEAIRTRGLAIKSSKGDFTCKLAQVAESPAEIGPVDFVLLAVKAWQVPGVAPQLRPLLGPDTRILPLQNGVEATGQLDQALGRGSALMGLCRIISARTAPGQIVHGGLDPMIALGESDGSPLSPAGMELASALRHAGVTVETPPDIRAALWGKLVFIAAASAVGAATRSTVGECRTLAPTRALLERLMEEVAAVGRAEGVALGADLVPGLMAFVETIPAHGTASMQRDILDGRPSELESIVGAVVRMAAARRVPVPALETIYAALLPQETRARSATPNPS